MRSSVVVLLILALVGSTVAPFLSVKANPSMIDVPSVPAPSSVHLTITMI